MIPTEYTQGHWFCTDPDSAQYCRVENDHTFHFVEVRSLWSGLAVCCGVVDLFDYTIQELLDATNGYYPSLECMVADYGFAGALRIIAECFFEQFDSSEMEFVKDMGDVPFRVAEQFVQTHWGSGQTQKGGAP